MMKNYSFDLKIIDFDNYEQEVDNFMEEINFDLVKIITEECSERLLRGDTNLENNSIFINVYFNSDKPLYKLNIGIKDINSYYNFLMKQINNNLLQENYEVCVILDNAINILKQYL